jgi:hypothetical protein
MIIQHAAVPQLKTNTVRHYCLKNPLAQGSELFQRQVQKTHRLQTKVRKVGDALRIATMSGEPYRLERTDCISRCEGIILFLQILVKKNRQLLRACNALLGQSR